MQNCTYRRRVAPMGAILCCGTNTRDQPMSDSAITVSADLWHDLAIASMRSTIVEVPTVRRHQLSSLSVTAQSYVIVELRLANGVEGIGEAATLGGPRWSEESVESIKATIDNYLTRVD
jgi:muconate cycloisomerase